MILLVCANHDELCLGEAQKHGTPTTSLETCTHNTYPHGEIASLRGADPLPIPWYRKPAWVT
jgi:hypothetical protein